MEYIKHLSKDPVLRKFIRSNGPLKVTNRRNVCLYLCRSVVSQQLSTKVARVIEGRLMELLPTGVSTPEAVLSLTQVQLRGIGLSAKKAEYIRNVACYFNDLQLTDATFRTLDDASVIELLTVIKGVGSWTAEMTLMFCLGRKDVFSTDDYGIQQAMAAAYGLDASDRKGLKSEMERIASTWSPYRTYACLHLWKSRDLGS